MYYLPFGKKTINETDHAENLFFPNLHLIKKTALIGIEKINSM